MRVKVIKEEIDKSRQTIVNTNMKGFLNIGEEYVVYALTILKDITYIQIYNERKLVSIPLDLFDVIDPRVSAYWLVSHSNDTTLFWPLEFYREYFHDDLFEEVPEVVQLFNNVRDRIETEYLK